MRTLKFITDGLSIRKDPQCDFSGIVPGTKGYLRAEFSFSHDWIGCEKMVVFSHMGVEEIPVRIRNNACMIPEKILVHRTFKMEVIGVRPGVRLKTNKLEVRQNG